MNRLTYFLITIPTTSLLLSFVAFVSEKQLSGVWLFDFLSVEFFAKFHYFLAGTAFLEGVVLSSSLFFLYKRIHRSPVFAVIPFLGGLTSLLFIENLVAQVVLAVVLVLCGVGLGLLPEKKEEGVAESSPLSKGKKVSLFVYALVMSYISVAFIFLGQPINTNVHSKYGYLGFTYMGGCETSTYINLFFFIKQSDQYCWSGGDVF